MKKRLQKILIIFFAIAALLLLWQRWAIPALGSFPFILAGLACLYLAFFLVLCLPWQNPRLIKISRVLRLLCLAVAIILVLSFVIVQSLIWSFAAQVRQSEPDAPCLLVLGAGLYGDKPSPILHNRLLTALEYMNAHPQSMAVLSGGQGPNEIVSEAFAMRSWLIDNGIEEERLHMEDRSTSTAENIFFSQPIIVELGYQRTVLVTNDFHVLRAFLLAKHYGLDTQLLAAPTPKFYLIPPAYIREYFALVKEWLLLTVYPQGLAQGA